MVRARSAKGRQKAPEPVRLIELEFNRDDLQEFVTNLRAHGLTVTDPEERHFLGTAYEKLRQALAVPGDLVRCEARAKSWRGMALASLSFKGGRIGQSLLRHVYLAERRLDLARARREQAENDAALKQAADELRAREAAEGCEETA